MASIDQRSLRHQLQQEFPELELHDWYVQFRALKASCPDAVLFYRLGDFYETFDDDAKLAAEKLGVTLTHRPFATPRGSKNKRQDQRRCPMAGMPYHAIERYASALVADGYRVAIAEQISETASSKSDIRPRSIYAHGIEQGGALKDMVDRQIVRVLTPGTVVDVGMLPVERNNYLAALITDGERIGLAYVDLSTGEFAATEISGERASSQAQSELARLQASEVLVPDKPELRVPGLSPASARLTQDLEFMTKAERDMLLPGERVARRIERESNARWAHGHVTATPTWRWEPRTARDALLQQFAVQSLAGYGLSDKPLATRAAAAIVQYLNETQAGATAHITGLRAYAVGENMVLDPQTRRNLELLEGSSGRSKGSLIGVLDQTRTPMGARLLRRWVAQPLLKHQPLLERQDAVATFADSTLMRAEVRETLRQIGDIERVANRILQGTAIATPRDLARLREGLRAIPTLLHNLGGWLPPDESYGHVVSAEAAFDDGDPFAELSEPVAADAEPEERGPSLREQRETRRRVQPRYETESLFGDDWDEPADEPELPVQPVPTSSARAQTAQLPHQTSISIQARWSGAGLDPCADVLTLLEQALDDEPPALLGASQYLRAEDENGEKPRRVIRPGYDRSMDEIVRASRDAQRWISELEVKEQQRTGIKSLRVDYNKVFGYYIEVAKSYADMVPSDYIRKQTLVTGERYITPTLKKYEDIVENAQQRLVELERRAFVEICSQLSRAGLRLLATARALAAIDVFAALAEAAVRGRYVRPELYDDTRLEIRQGRHPVVEQALEGGFVPNDVTLDTDEAQILVVTGPNMAGKSTTLRQVALIVLMAQIGSFVPAEYAAIGLVDRIFTRIGAQDDIATGQSTFMVEMTETAALLQQSTRRSLIILDEVGRGTSTYDGMAIARAVIEYIHNAPRLGCRTLFATHYHELIGLEEVLPRVRNYHMAAIEQDGHVVFLHEMRPGGADRSYGIHVAELAGIPRSIIRRATELLSNLEEGPRQPHKATQSIEVDISEEAPEIAPTLPHPALEALRILNVNELTPIEAMTRLYELQRMAKDG